MFNATPFLRGFASFRHLQLESLHPAKAQSAQLLRLVRQAAQTSFGKAHGFSSIKSVSEYQSRVPLRLYEAFWKEYWQKPFPHLIDCTWPGKIPFFAVSSGTSSGTTKYIPYTHAMTRSNARAGIDLLVHHVRNRPQSQLFGGRSFMLGGSTDFVELAPHVFSGDLSGIAVKTLPWWAKRRYFPPPELALLKNWEEKIATLGRLSLSQDIRMISGVPSWLLIFFDKVAELLQDSKVRISRIYPNLEMLVHGGVNFAPYHKRFLGLLEDSHAELREVYPASEGFVAVGDRGYGDGLRLMLDHGIFFEFVPLQELESQNPTRHWVDTIECGINYAIVVTTCAGLWAYVLGDTVQFVEKDPPRLLVTGRTSYYLSAFGEHVIAEEIEDSVSFATSKLNLQITDFSVGAIFPEKTGELGGHLYVIEFDGQIPAPDTLQEFALAIDHRLSQRNEDYEAHRANGFGLRSPQVLSAKSGMFAEWMKKRGKLGGQHKVPRIITSRELFEDLKQFATHYEGSL